MLNNGTLIAVRCRISRGGFSSERVFRVVQANGTDYIGAAPAPYFFGDDERYLPTEQPAERLVQIPGFVAARVIERKADRTLLLSVPSGDVVLVRPAEVVAYPANGSLGEKATHVPVQS